MYLTIPYTEAQQLAKEKTGKDVVLSPKTDKVIRTAYNLQVKVPIINTTISKEFGVDITYERLCSETLYLSCQGGTGITHLLEMVKPILPKIADPTLLELQDANKIVVHLDKTEEAHEVLQKINVVDMNFKKEGIVVEFNLR